MEILGEMQDCTTTLSERRRGPRKERRGRVFPAQPPRPPPPHAPRTPAGKTKVSGEQQCEGETDDWGVARGKFHYDRYGRRPHCNLLPGDTTREIVMKQSGKVRGVKQKEISTAQALKPRQGRQEPQGEKEKTREEELHQKNKTGCPVCGD